MTAGKTEDLFWSLGLFLVAVIASLSMISQTYDFPSCGQDANYVGPARWKESWCVLGDLNIGVSNFSGGFFIQDLPRSSLTYLNRMTHSVET